MPDAHHIPAEQQFLAHCEKLGKDPQLNWNKNYLRQLILRSLHELSLGDDTEVLLLGLQVAGLIQIMTPAEFDQHLLRRKSQQSTSFSHEHAAAASPPAHHAGSAGT